MLRAVRPWLQSGRDLPRALWIANLGTETCLPALATLMPWQTSDDFDDQIALRRAGTFRTFENH